MRLPQVLASALSDNFTSPIKPRLGNIVGVIKPSGSRADSGTNLVLRLFRFRSNGCSIEGQKIGIRKSVTSVKYL
ncbi:hypothetical protein EV1_001488 [Malus domestica]